MTKPFKLAANMAVEFLHANTRTARQVAALCYRHKTTGAPEVLLITSRRTGRWIIPKGWPMEGLTNAASALQEAWEEAGVTSDATLEGPAGRFDYVKRKEDGTSLPVEVEVFRVRVAGLADVFPEADERTRRWVSPEMAAGMVEEPRLRTILRDLSRKI